MLLVFSFSGFHFIGSPLQLFMHQLKPVIRQHTALEQVGKRTVQAIQHGFWIVGTEQAAVAPQGFYRIHIGAALAAFGVAAVGVLDGVGAAAAVADRQRVLRVFDVPGGALVSMSGVMPLMSDAERPLVRSVRRSGCCGLT